MACRLFDHTPSEVEYLSQKENMAMGDVEIDYAKLCTDLELQEQEVFD